MKDRIPLSGFSQNRFNKSRWVCSYLKDIIMPGRFYRGIELLLSIPKSFYVSWRLTSFKRAFKLPVKCRYNVKVFSTSGKLTGGGKLSVGFNRTGIYDPCTQRAILNLSGTLIVTGKLGLGAGSRLEIGKKGKLIIKGLVANSAGVTICCHDRIEIGDKTVISWDTLIIDKDFHYIFNIEKGMTHSDHKPISIGRGSWICAGAKVLKGSVLPEGCILGSGAVLNKAFDEPNCLIVGNPALIVKRGVMRSDKPIKII